MDLTGDWALTMHGPQGLVRMTLRLQQVGNDLRGTAEGPMGQSAVSGLVDGEEVRFTMRVDSGPGFEMTFTGTVRSDDEGERIDGSMKAGEVSAEFTARRSAGKAARR